MNSDKQKSNQVSEKSNSETDRGNRESIYQEFLNKACHLNCIQKDVIKINEDSKDMSDIVNNLSKCGLIVKKISKNDEDFVEENSLSDTVNGTDNSDDDNESEYEIETLDDDLDLEYIPELKKHRLEKLNKEPLIKSKVSQQRRTGEYIKIKSVNYLCILCDKTFGTMEELTTHMKNVPSCKVTVIACPICGKEFPSKSRCSSHMYTHKEKPKYPCEKCKKQFSNPMSLQVHAEFNHTDHFDSTDEGWKCKICNYISDSRVSVVHHVNGKHLNISAMLCDICGKSFVRESSLRAHIMTHRETRSYLCQICSKGFKMKSSLQAHIKTHNLEKRYVCDECGKSFKKNGSLTEHKKYHAGDFSFPCLWCDKRFVSKSLLNTHMKNHSA